ncbi:hypothetical protein EVA_21713 [gut metagenome]|uniref:Uncharacterized protein n=1 Tax=gut metagenome TaxID=749906 RepID=J9FS45_9ZZZZ
MIWSTFFWARSSTCHLSSGIRASHTEMVRPEVVA